MSRLEPHAHSPSGLCGGPRSQARKRVGVAEYAVDTDRSLSTSGLGSCVAVAVYEPGGIGGLLHAMLPRAEDVPGGHDAKCVDTGIAALYEDLRAGGANTERLAAKLAGGSAMLDLTGPAIGDRNVAVARETLAECDIPVLATDVGGKRGRSVCLSVPDGDLRVRCGDTTTVL
ncbi:MAG: chemotaxis protein CheD [Halalkalicoccus sp.]